MTETPTIGNGEKDIDWQGDLNNELAGEGLRRAIAGEECWTYRTFDADGNGITIMVTLAEEN